MTWAQTHVRTHTHQGVLEGTRKQVQGLMQNIYTNADQVDEDLVRSIQQPGVYMFGCGCGCGCGCGWVIDEYPDSPVVESNEGFPVPYVDMIPGLHLGLCSYAHSATHSVRAGARLHMRTGLHA